MVPIVITHLIALTLLIVSVYLDWWVGLTFVFAGIGGATVGSVGSLVRSRWSHLVNSPNQAARRRSPGNPSPTRRSSSPDRCSPRCSQPPCGRPRALSSR